MVDLGRLGLFSQWGCNHRHAWRDGLGGKHLQECLVVGIVFDKRPLKTVCGGKKGEERSYYFKFYVRMCDLAFGPISISPFSFVSTSFHISLSVSSGVNSWTNSWLPLKKK